MRRLLTLLTAVGVSLVSAPDLLAAGDATAGKTVFTNMCTACHGANGISANPQWPNLAGQKEYYLLAQLKDFKTRARTGAIMNGVAAGLSDPDIENVAAYLTKLACN